MLTQIVPVPSSSCVLIQEDAVPDAKFPWPWLNSNKRFLLWAVKQISIFNTHWAGVREYSIGKGIKTSKHRTPIHKAVGKQHTVKVSLLWPLWNRRKWSICRDDHWNTYIGAVFLYCCPNCPSCPVHVNSIGWATSAIWTAIEKYSCDVLHYGRELWVSQYNAEGGIKNIKAKNSASQCAFLMGMKGKIWIFPLE